MQKRMCVNAEDDAEVERLMCVVYDDYVAK